MPELELLPEQDKELLVTGRIVQCNWLLMCHRSAVQDVDGVVLSGGQYIPHNEANIHDNE
ncbi:hypothetical protein AAVH_29813 [Aphelenchoides avenae]|nr:hypothetical protein AAVH_29813 [Aphelenchus avenae]